MRFFKWRDLHDPLDWNEVRLNGVTARSWCPPAASPAGWTAQTIDLGAHIGQTVEVAFHFMASPWVNRAGWYIDDVEVRGGPGGQRRRR